MMKVSLFKAIGAADQVVVDGYEIDAFDVAGQSRVLSCGDDESWLFADQDIEVDADGTAVAWDSTGVQCQLTFKVSRPLQAVDLA